MRYRRRYRKGDTESARYFTQSILEVLRRLEASA